MQIIFRLLLIGSYSRIAQHWSRWGDDLATRQTISLPSAEIVSMSCRNRNSRIIHSVVRVFSFISANIGSQLNAIHLLQPCRIGCSVSAHNFSNGRRCLPSSLMLWLATNTAHMLVAGNSFSTVTPICSIPNWAHNIAMRMTNVKVNSILINSMDAEIFSLRRAVLARVGRIH